jgi:type VI protein secretion system component VasF
VTLEARAHQYGEFRCLLVQLVFEAHEPEQTAGVLVDRDESHLVAIVEMFELLDFLGAQLRHMGKETQPQVLGRNIAQEIRIERHVAGLGTADQHSLAAARHLMQFAQAIASR